MHYIIQRHGQKTAYLQLYEQLRQDIVTGVYPYGSRLPSKRLIAEESSVSVITVEHAYAILCDEGYTEARQRSGYYVCYRRGDFMSYPQSSASVLPAEPADPGQDPIPFLQLARTMRRVLLDYGDRILIKSPNHGCPELRNAISAYLSRSCGIAADPAQIIIGAGAEYLYSLILQLLGSQRIYALEDPSYSQIRRVYQSNGVTCRMLRLGNDGIVSSELAATDATVLHITPFHSYPSAVTASASKRWEYLDWAVSRDGYIVEDNYDSELTVSAKNEDAVFSLCDSGRVIYLNTFSHTVAPSVRAGYMVLPPQLLPVFGEKLGFYSCTVPVFEQYVLADLLTSGNFERHINRVRRMRRKRR